MKFERTEAFKADWRRLSEVERARFRTVVVSFHQAAEEHVAQPGRDWPASLRVKRVVKSNGVWEMTWSFSGPDGRVTFEWTQVDGAAAVRWRRIGGHEIFARP